MKKILTFICSLLVMASLSWGAITEATPRAEYTAAGGATYQCADTGASSAGWPIWVKTDLRVWLDDVLQVVDTDYTVTFTAGDASACSITFVTIPTVGQVVTMERATEQEKASDFATSGPFSMASLNSQIDYLTTLAQDNSVRINRTARLDPGEVISSQFSRLPQPEAGKALGYDGAGAYANLDYPVTSTWASGLDVPDYTTLRQLTGQVDGNQTFLAGRLAAGDGGGGIFVWDSSDLSTEVTADTVSGLYVAPSTDLTGASGAWVRQHGETIVPAWFGAFGGGLVDEVAELQAAATAAAGKTLEITKDKIFKVSSNGILIGDDTTVNGGGTVRNLDAGLDVACFRVDRTSSNIAFRNLILQGPYYDGTTVVFADWNAGIVTYGSYYRDFDPATGLARGAPLADAASSEDINVTDCDINGFATSGLQLDSIIRGEFSRNNIYHCGRDGIRAYGVTDANFNENTIDEMAPGRDGSAPHLNVYGITLTRRYNTPESEYPRSARCTVNDNVVSRCYTWKSLDTHGGQDITFQNNIVTDSHIGIGLSEGSGDSTIMARNVLVKGNVIAYRTSPGGGVEARNGIAVFGASGFGSSNIIEGNYVVGYGKDLAEGAISINKQIYCQVRGNTIANSLRAAVHVAGDSSVSITNNYIRDVATSVALVNNGISVEDADADVLISGNFFHRTTGLLDAVSMTSPTAGNGVTMTDDNKFQDVTNEVLIPSRLKEGSYLLQTWGFANVTNTGAASLASSKGAVASVLWKSTGVVEVTFSKTFSAVTTMFPAASTKTAVFYQVAFQNFTTSSVEVVTRDSAGALADAGFLFEIKGY